MASTTDAYCWVLLKERSNTRLQPKMKAAFLVLVILMVAIAARGQTMATPDTVLITVSELRFIIFSTHKNVRRLEKRIRKQSVSCCSQHLYPGTTLILSNNQNQLYGTYANESGIATFDSVPTGLYQLTIDVPYHIPLILFVDYNPNHCTSTPPPVVIVIKNLVNPRFAF